MIPRFAARRDVLRYYIIGLTPLCLINQHMTHRTVAFAPRCNDSLQCQVKMIPHSKSSPELSNNFDGKIVQFYVPVLIVKTKNSNHVIDKIVN